jgi:MFS family permease
MYRLYCNCCFAIFAQWAGNSVLSYFLPAVLDTAGYTNSVTKANINLGYSCFQFVFALTGAAFVDRIGRRPLMLFSMIGCTIVWIGMTTATAEYANTKNPAAAKATVAMIFIFGAVYSFGLTPLQALFPVEVLSFEMRAKGMAFSSLAVNAGGLLGQFAWPVALKNIGWKVRLLSTLITCDNLMTFLLRHISSSSSGTLSCRSSSGSLCQRPRTAHSRSLISSSNRHTQSGSLSDLTHLPSATRVMFFTRRNCE